MTEKILEQVLQAVSQAADFAKEQIPDIAMQYVLFGRVYETSVFALAIIAASLGVVLFSKADNFHSSNQKDGKVLAVIITASALVTAAAWAKSVALVWFAPKIWLLLEISKLVKN